MQPSKFSQLVSFFRSVNRERSTLSRLLSSGNYDLIRDYPPGHFYSPVPDVTEAREYLRSNALNKTLPAGIDFNQSEQLALLKAFEDFGDDCRFPDEQTAGARYYFNNPFFSHGDGIVLYSMIRHFRPARIIEIGSGFSSAAMLDTVDLHLKNSIEFDFIDPNPERLLSLLTERDRANSRLHKSPVQAIDKSLFEALRANDILFVDSSHVGKTASDVTHILFEILPRLAPGVIVHFHDIMWPFEYPASWVLGGRIWNEAYMLRSFLQFNSSFEMLFFNAFLECNFSNEVRSSLPRMMKASQYSDTIVNSSLWLRRK